MARQTDSGPSDAELVRRSLLGAKEAFAELVTRHWATAVALAARVLGSAELARDAAQEATVAALTGLDQLRSPERFSAWFCGIALNVSRRWLYQLHREIPGLPMDDLASASPGPAEIAEAADLARRVRDAITTLPGGQRDAVLLFYLQGLSHREAAAELGTSAGAPITGPRRRQKVHFAFAYRALADRVRLPPVRRRVTAHDNLIGSHQVRH
jgi:RNA polymerase sigma-70 factor (ECF subfamily)